VRRVVVQGLERNFTNITVDEAENGAEVQEKIKKQL
jgi:hypothetical protein